MNNKLIFKSDASLVTRDKQRATSGITLIEVLIAVVLMGVIGGVLHHSLSTGIKVWQNTQRMVIEEDISIFFDKISRDLKNSFFYSKIFLEGDTQRFAFPTIVLTPADKKSLQKNGQYIHQVGRAEYGLDVGNHQIYRRQANYSQAVNNTFSAPQVLVHSIDRLLFRYVYLTDNGEVLSEKLFETIPAGLEIEVEFSDNRGSRVMRKLIDIPVGS